MKKKRTAQSAFFNLRAAIAVLIFGAAVCSMLSGALLAFFRPETPAKVSQRILTFTERVAYQRAIEDVYWRHRIWPKERPDPKPSLDVVMSQAQLEKKVQGYLRDSQALENYRARPITAKQLQAEMDRMAQHTKQPEVLRELFKALRNDPFVIGECLARPALAERTLATLSPFKGTLGGSQFRPENQMPKRVTAAAARYKLPTISTGATGCVDDTWRPSPIDGRSRHTAVWTGSEMIVWGGGTNTGGRYTPATDSWLATTTANAPSARSGHTAVWTGSEMIVWGGLGDSGYLNTGGRYNPASDSWVATSTANAPTARSGHTAVWTGSEMIVWGGNEFGSFLSTGPRDNVQSALGTPTPTPTPPIPSGGKYDPGTNTWTATSTTNAPSARSSHTAVWTGSEMIVWGGTADSGYLNIGGRYNPVTNAWVATNMVNAPDGRAWHTAVWTGSEMIVWGGYGGGGGNLNTGGRYNPSTDTWTATSTANAPTGRVYFAAVWTGSEMIVWGGVDSDNQNTNFLNTGGSYNPATDSWAATSTINAPIGRVNHTAVWTGSEMIIWGGYYFDGIQGHLLNTGGRYNPITDNWTATTTTNAPSARRFQTAIWTGSEMVIWGGSDENTGGRYNPVNDSWIVTSTVNAPTARNNHTAVWTSSEMIVWGGFENGGWLNTGGRYNPSTDTWSATSMASAPSAREFHTAVWTGSEMIVWGGEYAYAPLNDGGRYDPETNSWRVTSTPDAPLARSEHTAVWTGSEMIVWAGIGEGVRDLNSGGRYCAQTGLTPTPTPTASPTATATPTVTPTPTPCTGRCAPTPRPRPTPAPRP